VFSAAIYSLIQAHPSFKDPDSFYHAKMALLTLKSGPVNEFPWLPFTTLADAYTDHHFLYHLILIPFVYLFGPLVGLKVATVLLGALSIVVFYFVARKLCSRAWLALISAMILATSMNFMFRMNLAKAASLSVIFLLLGVVMLARRRPVILAALSFLYVWAHGSWPLLLFLSICFWLTDQSRSRLLKKENLILLAAPWLGALAGLIINPFFPKNLNFYWYQTVHAALINYAKVINVGQEWFPYDPSIMFKQNGAVFITLILVAALWFAAWLWRERVERKIAADILSRQQSFLFFLLVVTGIFLLLAIKHQRHAEYFVPLAFLLSTVALDLLIRKFDLHLLLRLSFGAARHLMVVGVIFLCLLFPFLAARDVWLVTKSFHQDKPLTPWTRFKQSAEWLRQRLPANTVIFHANWADFPVLFYQASEFRYIAGLDPTFFYLKDPSLFVVWRSAAENRVTDLSKTIESFSARYVLARKDEAQFLFALASDQDFRLVYEDEEVKVFSSLLN
jgi:hypothetical protein